MVAVVERFVVNLGLVWACDGAGAGLDVIECGVGALYIVT